MIKSVATNEMRILAYPTSLKKIERGFISNPKRTLQSETVRNSESRSVRTESRFNPSHEIRRKIKKWDLNRASIELDLS